MRRKEEERVSPPIQRNRHPQALARLGSKQARQRESAAEKIIFREIEEKIALRVAVKPITLRNGG